MSLRQAFIALFLLSLLLHAHTSNVRKDLLRRKLSSTSSSTSLLETKSKSTHKAKTEYFTQYQQQQPQPQQQLQPQIQAFSPEQQPQQQAVEEETRFAESQDQDQQAQQTQTQTQAQAQEQGQEQEQGQAQSQAQAQAQAEQGKGKGKGPIGSMIGQAVGSMLGNSNGPPGSNGRVTGAAGRISNADSSCVACQYFVQTMINSMSKYSVLFANMPSPTSQGTVTSFPPYYNSMAAHPPLLPYGGPYANAVMNPFARIGMIEQTSHIKHTTHTKQATHNDPTLIQEAEVPQPDSKGDPPAYGTPRRYRAEDMTYWRDRLNRIDTVNPPNPDPMREQARYLESQMFAAVYQTFEGLCAVRVPESFVPYCQPVLNKFHIIAEGLHYGDRADQICMRNDFCPQDSYIRKLPHALLPRDH